MRIKNNYLLPLFITILLSAISLNAMAVHPNFALEAYPVPNSNGTARAIVSTAGDFAVFSTGHGLNNNLNIDTAFASGSSLQFNNPVHARADINKILINSIDTGPAAASGAPVLNVTETTYISSVINTVGNNDLLSIIASPDKAIFLTENTGTLASGTIPDLRNWNGLGSIRGLTDHTATIGFLNSDKRIKINAAIGNGGIFENMIIGSKTVELTNELHTYQIKSKNLFIK